MRTIPTRRQRSCWTAPAAVLAGVAALGYLGIATLLGRDTGNQLAGYERVVQLPERTAHLTITLP